jgi:hypothetical protein
LFIGKASESFLQFLIKLTREEGFWQGVSWNYRGGEVDRAGAFLELL